MLSEYGPQRTNQTRTPPQYPAREESPLRASLLQLPMQTLTGEVSLALQEVALRRQMNVWAVSLSSQSGLHVW